VQQAGALPFAKAPAAKNLNQSPELRVFAGAPRIFIRALVSELVFEAGHFG